MASKGLVAGLCLVAGTLALAAAAGASETATYTYDAKGRLIKVDRITTNTSGNSTTQYVLDKADNRNSVTVTTPP